jgi:hypothetical protein
MRLATNKQVAAVVAIGTAETIPTRLAQSIAAGAQKFILRPLATTGEDTPHQPRLLIDQILPEATRRWPKTPRAQ